MLYAVMSSLANLYSYQPDSWLGAQDCRVFTTLFIHASGRSLLPWVALEPDFSATACTELDSDEVKACGCQGALVGFTIFNFRLRNNTKATWK